MSKIYDCFNFFNELDILEIRLNTLYNHVDYFIIAEANVTHSGEKKPFIFEENKDKYSKFLDKIIHYKIEDTPSSFLNLKENEDKELSLIYQFINTQTNRFNKSTQLDYGRDFFQKESIRRALVNCSDDDIILFSDADEIPNPEIFINLNQLDLEKKYSLNQITYYYYLNVLKQKDWYGTKMLKYKNLKNLSLNELRGDEKLTIKLPNGGWHFSFMGGKEMVKTKILSYSARDLAINNPNVINSLNNNIDKLVDPFFRGNLSLVEIDDSYPEYILKNKNKYNHLIR